MTLTRRDLLKKGAAAGSLLALMDTVTGEAAASQGLKTGETQEFKTICPYCSVGCGIILSVKDGELVNAQGDPDHPINEGSLCSKGSSVMNLRLVADKFGKYTPNPRRVQKVMYRAPGSDKWEAKSWDWALDKIARNMKDTRDKTFKKTEVNKKDNKEYVVNRAEGMAFLGGAGLDNEECYLWSKFSRAMGVSSLEHQARL